MRELTVYYCSKCGRYGFYQVSKNAICPVCKTPMTVFPMSYQNFMDMDYNMRDQLISDQIAGNVTPQTSVVQRLTEQSKTSFLALCQSLGWDLNLGLGLVVRLVFW